MNASQSFPHGSIDSAPPKCSESFPLFVISALLAGGAIALSVHFRAEALEEAIVCGWRA